jgi:hypothetical protein
MSAPDPASANLAQIERLNQRGGETLSTADLVAAGTLDPALAAWLLAAVSSGASILTAARPGGAGKSTLLANLLAFLPPDEPIETVAGSRDVTEAFSRRLGADSALPACRLAHEIGSGHFYGYIWGRDAAQFLAIPRKTGARIASCLHADTLSELRDILLSPPIGAAPEDVDQVGVVLFMHVDRANRGWRHRVATVWEAVGDGHRIVWEWQRKDDSYAQVGETAVSRERLSWAGEVIESFLGSGETGFGEMLRHIRAAAGRL